MSYYVLACSVQLDMHSSRSALPKIFLGTPMQLDAQTASIKLADLVARTVEFDIHS
jgi:hypothetical protein